MKRQLTPESMPKRKRVTIRDVAKLADVSIGTISRVLNGNATVLPDTRRKVEEAISALGYTPSAIAQSMRRRVTHTVGCVIRDINNPALASFLREAHDVLHDAGYALLITNSEGQREREFELMELLARRQADGIMIGHYSERDEALLALLEECSVPLVLINRASPNSRDAVMTDHCGTIRQATEFLLGLGHRRIALITGQPDLYPARQRIAGLKAGYANCALPFDPSLIRCQSFLPDYGYRQTRDLLASSAPPTAFIAGGIDMLPGVMQAIRDCGLSIPADISLIGSTDSDLAQLATPSITVESWDMREVGRIAASLLLDRLQGATVPEPRRILLPSRLVLRDSCAPPPA